ncbi:3'-5' exonuclease [Loa loa]|uniref:3'-5' exonuclease n=1 Tax=Loa loa TaxID=7209 RepID=A0A1I7VF61_LOALO|nr:3'-5' exonuclease [Loa loa]EFO27811.2 3'-5' exonuclease [Loa loa]
MSDEQSTSNPNDILDSVKNVKLCAVRAVGEANALPMRTEGYELYASFPLYTNLMMEQQRRITVMLRELLRNAGCRIPIPARINDLDEFLDRIVEANDNICERAGILLDLLQKARRMEEVVVPQQILDAESTAASEQTLFEKQGRYTALLRRLPGYKDKLSSSAAVPLLTSKEKPQVVFGIEVDNSFAEFKPKLREKHHAMENLVKNLQIVDNDNDIAISTMWRNDQGISLHPYYKELHHFKIPTRQLTVGMVQSLKALSDTELVYVDTVEKLRNLRDILNKEQEFSVDLEHNAQRSFLGLTCLMQISTRQTDYIIDPFPLWNDMHILNEPFTDPNILKVFHGADSDIVWLQRDFGIYVVNMFDTYKAMRVLNYSKFSYQHLVQTCCNHTLDKKFQKADWRLRPLTGAHKTYARSDTHYLLHCYDQLRIKLLDQGDAAGNLLEYVYNESAQTCLTVYKKPVFESDGYEKLLVGRKPLNSRQQFALAALWKWRDERARADDESPQYVLPCHMLLQIAEVLPREMQGILACCSPVPVHVKQELHVLHQIINTSRDQPLLKRPIYAPNIGSLTLEGVTSQLNKMNAVKAMLRCHLDFSSTKYNEEIRDIVVQDVDRAICKDGAATGSCDSLFSTELYTIGEDNEKEDERLTKVMEKLEDWATPYECYRIAMMEQSSKAKIESKKKEDAARSEQSAAKEKKLWSHLDSAANKPGFVEEKVAANELQMESEQRKNAANEMNICEEMTLTKKELKKRRKRGVGQISIATTQKANEIQKSGGGVVEKRGRKNNWTDAVENCDQRVDYSTFNPEIFNKNTVSISNTYDPFKQWKRGKSKPHRGRRMMQSGRKL